MEENLEAKNRFIELRPTYEKLSAKVAQIIEEVLKHHKINYHAVTFRTKTIKSFGNKISNPKYDDPFKQITDLSGIRVVGFSRTP